MSDDSRVVGFTGTRQGMTALQRESFAREIQRFSPTIFHHGCCTGADEEAHNIVRELFPECIIVGHPASGVQPRFRSDVKCDERRPPRQPLERNLVIVRESSRVIATPAGPETGRGGTWSTIRACRRIQREVSIILPNGAFFV